MPVLIEGRSVRPGGDYVNLTALAFTDSDAVPIPVDAAHPLPVAPAGVRPSAAAAITGTLTGTAVSAAFTPDLARPIWVTLTGSWSGEIVLLRSIDGGTTKLPLTIAGRSTARWTANANEPAAEETVSGATYYLQATLTAGSVSFRVMQ